MTGPVASYDLLLVADDPEPGTTEEELRLRKLGSSSLRTCLPFRGVVFLDDLEFLPGGAADLIRFKLTGANRTGNRGGKPPQESAQGRCPALIGTAFELDGQVAGRPQQVDAGTGRADQPELQWPGRKGDGGPNGDEAVDRQGRNDIGSMPRPVGVPRSLLVAAQRSQASSGEALAVPCRRNVSYQLAEAGRPAKPRARMTWSRSDGVGS